MATSSGPLSTAKVDSVHGSQGNNNNRLVRSDSTRAGALETVYYRPIVQKYPFDSEADCVRSIPRDAFNLEKPYCNVTYDAVLCWPPTKAGVIIMQSCPPLRGLDLTKYAFRTCSHSGYWEFKSPDSGGPNLRGWTNYSVCIKAEVTDLYHKFNSNPHAELFRTTLHGTRIMEMIGLSLSLISLLVALVIFFSFRSLRNDRTKIHRNLFIAILIQVLIRLTLYSDQYVTSNLNFAGLPINPGKSKGISNTPYLCESYYVFLEYAKTVSFMWMLVEGFYLHNIIVASVFESRPNMGIFNLIGWGAPLILTGMWAVTHALKTERTTCWYLYSFARDYWILEGARVAVIVVNLIFLLNIIRVLVSKLRDTNSTDAEQAKKAVKAALILLPLLGITNSVSLVPVQYKPVHFVLWTWGAYFLVSFQGFFVALIYCFLNQEVRDTLHNAWKRRLFNKGKHPNRESNGSIISRLSLFARELPTGHFSEKIHLRRLNSAQPIACARPASCATRMAYPRPTGRLSVASYFTSRFNLHPSSHPMDHRATVKHPETGTTPDHTACTKATLTPVVGPTQRQSYSGAESVASGTTNLRSSSSSSYVPCKPTADSASERSRGWLYNGFGHFFKRPSRPSSPYYDPLIPIVTTSGSNDTNVQGYIPFKTSAPTLAQDYVVNNGKLPARENSPAARLSDKNNSSNFKRLSGQQTKIIVTIDPAGLTDGELESDCIAASEPSSTGLLSNGKFAVRNDTLKIPDEVVVLPTKHRMYGQGTVYQCPDRKGHYLGCGLGELVFEEKTEHRLNNNHAPTIPTSISNETAFTLLLPSPEMSPTG